jgi:hypothetical protein
LAAAGTGDGARRARAALPAWHPRLPRVTVNTLLPGGATLTGMILDTLPPDHRRDLLDLAIMVPPILWLASAQADSVTGCRVTANRWVEGDPSAAVEPASWVWPEV